MHITGTGTKPTTVRFLISSMTRGQKDCRVCWASLPLAPKASVDILYSVKSRKKEPQIRYWLNQTSILQFFHVQQKNYKCLGPSVCPYMFRCFLCILKYSHNTTQHFILWDVDMPVPRTPCSELLSSCTPTLTATPQ